MSNKQLVFAVIGIVAAAAVAVLLIRSWRGNEEGTLTYNYNQSENPLLNQQQSAPPQNAETQAAMEKVMEKNTDSCQRAFDQNKLASEKVDIKDRQVEISIKGFGNVRVSLYDKDAPKAVENFLRLVNAGYYDCLTFHRVARGFVIQGGDPTGTGSGGDSAFGGEFADELNPETPSFKEGYKKGVLAMANRGPNTNTSQFFIMLEDVPLDNNYTIFGKVVEGQEAVDKVGQVEITPQMGPTDGRPVSPVVMEKVTIIK